MLNSVLLPIVAVAGALAIAVTTFLLDAVQRRSPRHVPAGELRSLLDQNYRGLLKGADQQRKRTEPAKANVARYTQILEAADGIKSLLDALDDGTADFTGVVAERNRLMAPLRARRWVLDVRGDFLSGSTTAAGRSLGGAR